MSNTQPHADVYAVLGKSSPDMPTSREFEWRLDELTKIVSDPQSPTFYLAICGNQREAEYGLKYLTDKYPTFLPPESRRFVDPLSRHSIDNFIELGRFLVAVLSKDLFRIKLTVLSSDYHIDRLLFIDEHLSPQSLVNEVNVAVRRHLFLAWKRSEFRKMTAQLASHVSWVAEVYTAAERLMPLQVNLEALIAGRLNRVVRPVWEEFRRGVDAIKRLLDNLTPQIRKDLGSCLSTVTTLVTQIERDSIHLSPLSGTIGAVIDETVLRHTKDSVAAGLRALRSACDPDAKAFRV